MSELASIKSQLHHVTIKKAASQIHVLDKLIKNYERIVGKNVVKRLLKAKNAILEQDMKAFSEHKKMCMKLLATKIAKSSSKKPQTGGGSDTHIHEIANGGNPEDYFAHLEL